MGQPAAGLSQESTRWRTAYLTQSTVLDITITDAGDAWAVGENGVILHNNGVAWRNVSSPTDETLHAVAFAATDDGWAVGEGGTILRYDGVNWRITGGPAIRPFDWTQGRLRSGQVMAVDELFDIELVGAGGWAVGRRYNTLSATFSGLILHLTGGIWTEVSMPQTEPLFGVAFASADQGWAVGEAGTILRWDGHKWTVEESQTNVDLYDIAIADGDFWAVGKSGFLVHWNQDRFFVESRPYGDLTGVAFVASDAGWAVGAGGTVLNYDGITWTQVDTPLGTDLHGLSIGDDGLPWVTGEGGLIGRVLEEGWRYVTQPYVDVDLTAIDLLQETAGWAVGARPFQPTEGVVFWQLADDLWNPHQLDETPPLFDVDMLSKDEAWAVGQDFQVDEPTEAGVVWHYASGVWTSAAYPGVSALFAVEAIGPDDVWAAGQDGTLLHYNGAEWVKTPMPENVHLYGLHFRTPDDGWVVGERFDLGHDPPRYLAVAFHFDGETWTETPVPIGPPRLLAVCTTSESDVWAVGNLGAILYFNGQSWAVVQGQQEYNLLDIDFSTPDDGWAVGSQGTILRYRDGIWSLANSPTMETLNGVVSRPQAEAWVVGSHGTFLYHPSDRPWSMYLPLVER
ncbi:MAG: YCF48-related protein [Anaerolineae bacterium]